MASSGNRHGSWTWFEVDVDDLTKLELRLMMERAARSSDCIHSALRIAELAGKLAMVEFNSLVAEMHDCSNMAIRQQAVLDQAIARISDLLKE